MANLTLIGAAKGYSKVFGKGKDSLTKGVEKAKYEMAKRKREREDKELQTLEETITELSKDPENAEAVKVLQEKLQQKQEKIILFFHYQYLHHQYLPYLYIIYLSCLT